MFPYDFFILYVEFFVDIKHTAFAIAYYTTNAQHLPTAKKVICPFI